MLRVLLSSCSANIIYDVMPNRGVPDSCLMKQVRGVFSAGSCSLLCLSEEPSCSSLELRNEICRLGSCLTTITPDANSVAYGKFGCPTDYVLVGQGCYRLIKELRTIKTARTICESESGYLASPETEEQLRALINYIRILNPQRPNSSGDFTFGVLTDLTYQKSSGGLLRQGVVINVADDLWAVGCPQNENRGRINVILNEENSFKLCNVIGTYGKRLILCQKDPIHG